MENLLSQRKYLIILILIVILATFLRFYNFSSRVSFDRDASLDALVARNGSQELQFPLVGPFSSAAPITTGPWYYYQMTLANLVIPSDYAPWISFAISSIILVFAMYRVGIILHNNHFGLLLALLAAISPVQVSLSTGLGNASVLGQFSGIIIWIFLEIIINKKGYLWQLFLGFMLGLAFNYHFQSILLMPFFSYIFFQKNTFWKSLFFGILGFFISLLPLLFFDLNNHWYNSKHIIQFIRGENVAIEIKRWLTYLFTFWSSLLNAVTGISKPFSISILPLGAMAYFYTIKNSKRILVAIMPLLIFTFQFLFLRYYRGPLRENYVQFLHPFIFLLTGSILYSGAVILSKFIKNIIISQSLLILIFLVIIYPQLSTQMKINAETIALKQEVKNMQKMYGGSNIAVFRCAKSNSPKAWSMALMLDMNRLLLKEESLETPALKLYYPDELCKNGWESVTPKTTYDMMVKWWYAEKP